MCPSDKVTATILPVLRDRLVGLRTVGGRSMLWLANASEPSIIGAQT